MRASVRGQVRSMACARSAAGGLLRRNRSGDARPLIPLLPGEAVTPLERLLLVVDSANGISAELPPSKFMFVPVNLTVDMERHPRREWVGMSARTTIDSDGVGPTRADLFDQQGFVGVALQSLFVAPQRVA